jgi:hypothetical protein
MGRGSNKSVKNKNARSSLCFTDFNQDPVYEEGKGTVVSFGKTIPVTTLLRANLREMIPGKPSSLLAEGNSSKTYIEFTVMRKRYKVICARLGKSIPMVSP